MRGKEKAQRGLGGGQMTTAANQLSTLNYSTDFSPLQVSFNRHWSSLLDQTIAHQERHLHLARFHYAQASRHRQIRTALEAQIFGDEQ